MLTTHFIINSPVVASSSRGNEKITGPAAEVVQHCPGKIERRQESLGPRNL